MPILRSLYESEYTMIIINIKVKKSHRGQKIVKSANKTFVKMR